jgi:hypothetical protein
MCGQMAATEATAALPVLVARVKTAAPVEVPARPALAAPVAKYRFQICRWLKILP